MMSLEDVARFYYANLPDEGRVQWRLSTDTLKVIARQVPAFDGMGEDELTQVVTDPGSVLCGASIIVDDSVAGLVLEPMSDG